MKEITLRQLLEGVNICSNGSYCINFWENVNHYETSENDIEGEPLRSIKYVSEVSGLKELDAEVLNGIVWYITADVRAEDTPYITFDVVKNI